MNYLHTRNICHLLTDSAFEILLLSLCTPSGLCKHTLAWTTSNNHRQFHSIQNMCAYLVLRRSKRSSITQYFKDLYWLPICQRIEFKILTLTYQCLNKQVPEYLQNLLVEMPNQRSGLRSELTYKKLLIPFMKRKTFGQRSFSAAASTLWNGLPLNFKQAITLNQFKSMLKTPLFHSFKTISSHNIP